MPSRSAENLKPTESSRTVPVPPRNLTVATTGASGAIFLRHFLLAIERDPRVQTVNFIASDSALRVLAEELGLRGRNNLIGQVLGKAPAKQRERFTCNQTPISAPTSPAVLTPATR